MKKWILEQWGNILINPQTTGSTGKVLVADVHRSQLADGAKSLLKRKSTELVNVLPGCTSRVQLLHVSFNKPFKDVTRQQFEKHLEQNLQRYTKGKISASERRALVTEWVGKAWTEVGSNRDMVVRSFKKCGISLSLDGSENGEIRIESIEEYESPTANEITEFELDSEDEIEDDEDNFEVTDSCSSSKNESCG